MDVVLLLVGLMCVAGIVAAAVLALIFWIEADPDAARREHKRRRDDRA